MVHSHWLARLRHLFPQPEHRPVYFKSWGERIALCVSREKSCVVLVILVATTARQPDSQLSTTCVTLLVTSRGVRILDLEEVLHCAPPSNLFGSSHPSVFGGRWVSPFLGRGGVAFDPFGGGRSRSRSLGLGKERGSGTPVLARRVGESFGDIATSLFHL